MGVCWTKCPGREAEQSREPLRSPPPVLSPYPMTSTRAQQSWVGDSGSRDQHKGLAGDGCAWSGRACPQDKGPGSRSESGNLEKRTGQQYQPQTEDRTAVPTTDGISGPDSSYQSSRGVVRLGPASKARP